MIANRPPRPALSFIDEPLSQPFVKLAQTKAVGGLPTVVQFGDLVESLSALRRGDLLHDNLFGQSVECDVAQLRRRQRGDRANGTRIAPGGEVNSRGETVVDSRQPCRWIGISL